MAREGVFIKLQGVDNAIAQLRALPDKLRKRAILNALRAGGRVFRDEARRLTPVLQVPVRRKGGGVIRKPGTVQEKSGEYKIPQTASASPWGVVDWIMRRTDRSIKIDVVGFGIDSSPALPAVWPLRSNFGLSN